MEIPIEKYSKHLFKKIHFISFSPRFTVPLDTNLQNKLISHNFKVAEYKKNLRSFNEK